MVYYSLFLYILSNSTWRCGRCFSALKLNTYFVLNSNLIRIIRTGLGILVLSILFFFIHKFSGYEVLQTG